MYDEQKSFPQLLEELRALRAKNVEMQEMEAQHVSSKHVLRKMQAEKQQLLDIAGVVIILIDTDEQIALLNKKGCSVLGIAESEAIGKNWFDTCVPLRERENVRAIFRELMEGRGESVEYAETPVLSARGEERIIAWHNTVVRDEDGRIIGTLSSGEEITERKRIETALRESEEKYRNLVDNAMVGIYKTSINGELLYVNDALVKILGYESRREMMAENVVVSYKNPDDRLALLRAIKETGKVEGFEIQVIAKTGEEKTILLSSYLENDVISGMFMDVTERRKAEAQREKMHAETLQSQKMEAMAAVAEKAARDFSRVVNAILENSREALRSIGGDHPASKYVMRIESEGSRAASLTQQLLLVKGGHLSQAKIFNPGDTMAAVLPDVKRIVGNDVTVLCNVQPDLWDMIGDEQEIELMIMNLVVNGREAMPDGGALRIDVGNATLSRNDCNPEGEARPGAFIRLAVADEGPGIDPASIPHIFDPFFTTNDRGEGAGLGLSVVYGIVKQHDGWVSISSRRGAGSTFAVYLPAAGENAEA
jgi:PAS domain S-box-containing protein